MVWRSAFSPMPVWKYWISRFSVLPFDMGISFSGLSLDYSFYSEKTILVFPTGFLHDTGIINYFTQSESQSNIYCDFVVTGS